MNKNKIIAVGLLATSLMATTPAFASSFKNTNHNGCGLEEVNSGKQFAYFVINGKVINHAHPRIRGGITLVSAPDILNELGIEYTTPSIGMLNISINGDEYVFWARSSYNTYYTKNGEKIYNKVVEQNGVKVPENGAQCSYEEGKIFIPLSFFTEELGYSDAFSVDNSYNLTMGSCVNFGGGTTSRLDDFITGEKKNINKTVEEGWVCPTLQSVSRDNVVDDAKALENELEFDANGSTSAIFKPQGTKVVSVGPFATGSTASHFTAINIMHYNEGNESSADIKANKIVPQVLKFYFPNNWQKIDELLKTKSNGVRYTIDGRDTVIEGASGYIFMSRVNGSLQGHLAKYNSQGTIGTAYDVQTSYTGYWTKYGTQYWHYVDSNQNFVVGWKQIDGKWYYFDENGRMLTNTVVNGYKINADGVWVQ